MPQKRVALVRMTVILLAIVTIITSIRQSSDTIRDKLQLQIQDTMQDVSEQNALAMQKEIEAKFRLLRGLAKEVEVFPIEQHDQMMNMLEPFTDVYSFKRIGFAYPDGTTCTTDDHVSDLSFREFFKKSLVGEEYISDVLMDSIGKSEKINVFSVPVYEGKTKEVVGVLFATYRTSMFRDLLQVECFKGAGYSFVIRSDGTIIADSDRSPLHGSSNVFSSMLKLDIGNADMITEMRRNMTNRKDGFVSYTSSDSTQYTYYMPLHSMATRSWYILTIAPSDILFSRVNSVMQTVTRLLGVLVLVLVLTFFYYLYSYQKQKNELIRLAYKDPLTGGNNYASFMQKMKKKAGCYCYIVSMDIYEFRIINNTCGVNRGDEVLKNVWSILTEHLHDDECAAHINADRFILCLCTPDCDMLLARIDQIYRSVSGLSTAMNIPRVMPYFGIYPTDAPEDTETAYGCANQAKHLVKGRIDSFYSFYEDVDFQQKLENRRLEDGFEEAIKNHRFEVWYQPKYSTADQSIVSAEALVRWRDTNGDLIPPFKFIPLFEQNGMIAALDEYVFRTVCAQQKLWHEAGRPMLPISVNISRATLYYSNVVDKYRTILDSYGLPPQYVELEITESAAVNNTDIQNLIDEFHQVGFHLLLDDFGNGYSSLATLNLMHFDTLKLDKSLIDYIGNQNGEKLLYHIIKLAQSLGLKITAEGVEEKTQFEFLQQLRCDDIQGYYFSKPLPLDNYQALLYSSLSATM